VKLEVSAKSQTKDGDFASKVGFGSSAGNEPLSPPALS